MITGNVLQQIIGTLQPYYTESSRRWPEVVNWKPSEIYKYNVSIKKRSILYTTKNSILSGRHVSTFIRSSSGPLGLYRVMDLAWRAIKLMLSIPKCYINTTCQSITQHFILYTIKRVYCQGDMFRPLLCHLQVLWAYTGWWI